MMAEKNNTNARKEVFSNIIHADKKPQASQLTTVSLLEEVKQQLISIAKDLVKIKKSQATHSELLENLSKKISTSKQNYAFDPDQIVSCIFFEFKN